VTAALPISSAPLKLAISSGRMKYASPSAVRATIWIDRTIRANSIGRFLIIKAWPA